MRLVLTLVGILALVPAAGGAALPRDYDPVLSPSGKTVAFVHSSGSAISIQLVDATGLHRRTLASTPFGAQYLAWSPDGKSLAYSDRNDIWRVDVATKKLERLTNDESTQSSESWQPSWSPDGDTIAYARFQDCFRCTAIWLMDSDGSNMHMIYNKSLGRRPTFSPDGTELALSLGADLVIDTNGNPVVTPGNGAYAIWSPNGTYVAYTGSGLWLHNLQTGAVRRLTMRINAQIAWSPDGKWIAGGSRGGVALVYAKDGSHFRKLPASSIEGGVPSFSHGLLAYAHAGECGIDVAREDGTRARRLTRAC